MNNMQTHPAGAVSCGNGARVVPWLQWVNLSDLLSALRPVPQIMAERQRILVGTCPEVVPTVRLWL